MNAAFATSRHFTDSPCRSITYGDLRRTVSSLDAACCRPLGQEKRKRLAPAAGLEELPSAIGIARAFLSSEAAIAQRIVRAKKRSQRPD
jgi:predicted RNA polymerase sigma factor